MRVLQLGPFPPPWGGVQTHLISLRDYLRRHGAPCSVVNITANRKPDADQVYYPRNARALLALLASLEYDIVHTHVGGHLPNRVLGLLLVTAMLPRKRAVFTFHSGGFSTSEAGRKAQKNSPLGYVLRRLDAVIGVNSELIDFFHRVGVKDERAHLIYPHSFGPELHAIAARGRGGLPAQMDAFFDRHGPVLLSVGLLEPEYDLDSQILALGQLRMQHPSAGLIIAGSGSIEPELRARIAALPWGEHVFLAGDVPREQTLAAIAASDVLLRTTLFDGDAISVREALYIGTPVIATDNGMRPQGVHLVPKQNVDALVASITTTLSRVEGRHANGVGTNEENLAAIVQVYRGLLLEVPVGGD